MRRRAPAPFAPAAVALAVALAGGGCADRGSPTLPEEPGGPEPTVSFAADVQPIFDQRCIVCHDSGGTSGLRLVAQFSYADLVGVTATSYAAVRIAPGDPQASVLYNKITDTGLYGGRMPAVGDPLTAPQIQTIRTWIEEGAPDN